MKYYKDIENGYITAIGTGSGVVEITAEEYMQIMAVIKNRPIPAKGKDYVLTEFLEWEECDKPVIEREDMLITGDEFMAKVEEVL